MSIYSLSGSQNSQKNLTHAEIGHRPWRHVTIMRYGSLPLMTYLPDGDIDLVIATFDEHGVLQDDGVTEACLDM